jgi:YVTN family beta-propeller protein
MLSRTFTDGCKAEKIRSAFACRQLMCRAICLIAFCLHVAIPARAQHASPQGGIITSHAIVFNPASQKVYVVDTSRDSISVIPATSQTSQTINVGRAPIAIAVNTVTGRVYVANHDSGSVSVIDGKSDQVIATIPVDKLPYALAVDERTDQVFVSSVYSNELKIINGADNSVSSLKAISADAMLINTEAGVLYLMSYESSSLTVLNIPKRTFNTLPIGQMHLWAMARNPATGNLYVTRIGHADLVKYDEKSHMSTVIKTGNYPCAIALNRRTNKVYVVNYADETVTVIDGEGDRVLATLKVGDHPQAIAINESVDEAYVANVHGDSITVIDGSKNVVTRTVRAGKHPYGIVVNEKNGGVITANAGEPPYTIVKLNEHP